MEWFRFYHEALDDLKVQSLPPATFKHWVNMLCLANLTTPRGTLPELSIIAYRLRVSPSKAQALVDEFVDRGLIESDGVTLHPHNWSVRQRVSDDVAKRVAKHRSNVTSNVSGNANVTVTRDRTDTDTDTDTEQKQSRTEETPKPPSVKPDPKPPTRPTYSDDFELFWSAYPKGRGGRPATYQQWKTLSDDDKAAAMAAIPLFWAGRDWIEGFHKAPDLWLKDRRWENPPEPAKANGRASPSNNRGMTNEEIRAYGRGEHGEQRPDDEDVIDAPGRVVERGDHPGKDRGLSLAS